MIVVIRYEFTLSLRASKLVVTVLVTLTRLETVTNNNYQTIQRITRLHIHYVCLSMTEVCASLLLLAVGMGVLAKLVFLALDL